MDGTPDDRPETTPDAAAGGDHGSQQPGPPPDPAAGDAYALFVRGSDLLEQRLYAQAAISLEQARRLEPGKISILEALGRAYFHTQRYRQAAAVFGEVVDRRPDEDFSQFCLGRSLEMLGDLTGARRHMGLAVGMRPGRADYRRYFDRIRDRR